MSFDVFVQAFRNGDAARVDAACVLQAFSPFSTEPVSSKSARIQTSDGEAQIFGLEDASSGFMVNHASGRVIWDALVHVADATGMAILPIGCPTCVTRPEFLEHLPMELQTDALIVSTGEQLTASFD